MECNWQTFEDFSSCTFVYFKIKVDKDANEFNWKKSTCTCPIYLGQCFCKHINAACIFSKKDGNQIPWSAKNVLIGIFHGLGRPRLSV